MSRSWSMPDIEMLVPDEWFLLRNARLAALKDSPNMFLHTHAEEREFDEPRWRQEFTRGTWYVGFHGDDPVSLLGCTVAADGARSEHYLEYLWVAPEARGNGVGYGMMQHALGRLRASGITDVFLWVLDGNDAAMRLYGRLGFVSSNQSQPLPGRPERHEYKMQLRLG